MIITIFGATGQVGKQLVHQALMMGHSVRAFGRNVFTAGFPENEKLQLISGTLFSEESVYEAVLGVNLVLSALGGSSDGVDKTRSLGIKNIVAQMEKAGVKKIIAVGGMGVLDTADKDVIFMDTPAYPKQFLPVGKEHFQAYQTLLDSSLDWTFVGPPDLIDADPTGKYYTSANTIPVENTYKINTGDLALFMLTEAERGEYIHQRVGISN